MNFKYNFFLANYGDIDAFTCNYGWAFAVAKAVEIYGIHHSKYPSTTSLSAQQLIDCWGIDNCKAGFPHKALEYLTKYHQVLYSANNYRYVGKKNDFCTIDISGYPEAGSLKGFSVLDDKANEDEIKSVLYNFKTPIIIEIDPNAIQFMTYKSGVYNNAVSYNLYSHFMLIVGYGTETYNGKEYPYWKLMNTWGPTWGENGYMKLSRTSGPTLKKYVFPSEY